MNSQSQQISAAGSGEQDHRPAVGNVPPQDPGAALKDEAVETLARGQRRLAHEVSQRPMASLAVCFLAGAAVGSLVVKLLAEEGTVRDRRPSQWMERVGQRIADAVVQAVPDALNPLDR